MHDSKIYASDIPALLDYIAKIEAENERMRDSLEFAKIAKNNAEQQTRQNGVKQGLRIRRLTPRECMRLQGVPDYITDKLIAAGISDTQLYRAAGDACTVPVIYAIASRMEAHAHDE